MYWGRHATHFYFTLEHTKRDKMAMDAKHKVQTHYDGSECQIESEGSVVVCSSGTWGQKNDGCLLASKKLHVEKRPLTSFKCPNSQRQVRLLKNNQRLLMSLWVWMSQGAPFAPWLPPILYPPLTPSPSNLKSHLRVKDSLLKLIRLKFEENYWDWLADYPEGYQCYTLFGALNACEVIAAGHDIDRFRPCRLSVRQKVKGYRE